jgi:hypothetical protein
MISMKMAVDYSVNIVYGDSCVQHLAERSRAAVKEEFVRSGINHDSGRRPPERWNTGARADYGNLHGVCSASVYWKIVMNVGARLWQVIQPGEKLLFQQPDRYCRERMFSGCFRCRLHAQVPQRHNILLLHYLFCLTRANCIFNLTIKGL